MSDCPWVTALEMKFAVLRIAREMLARDTPQSLRFTAQGTAALLPRSEVYAWGREPSVAVTLAARSLPASSTLHLTDLPSPVCWWWFADPLPIAVPDAALSDRMGRTIGALMLGPMEQGRIAVVVHRWTRREADHVELLMPTSVYALLPGTTLQQLRQDIPPDGDPDAQFRARRAYEVTRFVIAACAWLRQRVLGVGTAHVERHARRRLEREHHVPIPSTAKVIQLRRRASEPHEPRPEGSDPVEWSCRWIVNGHWRHQLYKDKRELIYILPYVKGPADQPLRVPSHTVYAVTR